MITINSDMMSRPKPNEHYLKVRQYLSNDCMDIVVVVQAFGRLDKTRACIESILQYTTREFELILLDNGTEENDLVEYFEDIDFQRKELIKISKNITGVFALNKTLHALAGKYIVWVNNDIVVTQNWLDNLIACADSDDSIGMICPVSSNISNLQGETLGGFGSIEEMQMKAAAFNISDPSKWEERLRLIPSATLYRKEIFDVVGMYDTGFMHDFGDDDFSFRVRRAGYKLIVCRDTFVHHDHDQKALPQERMEIMQQSRNFFREKYYGIDAWDDTNNYLFSSLNVVEFDDKEKKHILALDVKCGTPILEVKNHLKKQYIETGYCKAYTSDAKYYVDLQGMSNEVICGDIEQTIKVEQEQYDVIVLGKPLNCYNQPLELIKKLVQLKKDGGYIIFSIKNTYSVVQVMRMMGLQMAVENLNAREMHYMDVYSEIKKHGIVKGELNCKNYNVSESLVDKLHAGFKVMDVGGDHNSAFSQLRVDEYMMTVS